LAAGLIPEEGPAKARRKAVASRPARPSRHRSRSVSRRSRRRPASQSRGRPQLSEPVAPEGWRGRQGAPSPPGAQDGLQRDQKPEGCRGCVGQPLRCLESVRQRNGPGLRRCHRTMGEGPKRHSGLWQQVPGTRSWAEARHRADAV